MEEVEIPGAVCAAKKIHTEFLSIGSREDIRHVVSKFASECRLMSTLRHPHIVQFLGVCYISSWSKAAFPCHGASGHKPSRDLLETTPNLPLAVKNSILLDTSRGLLYLHSQSPPIIHRDLTARNVLLNSAMVAKIADLGVARIVDLQPDQLASMTRGPGNIVYMPPEAMGEHTKYNSSLDIFSFGNVALFTLTQEFVGPKLKAATYTDNAGKLCARTEIDRREHGFRILYRDLGRENVLAQLTRDCLQNHPIDRPSAAELVGRIKGISSDMESPSKLELMKQLSSKEEEIRSKEEENRQMTDDNDQLSSQKVSLQQEIENNHTELTELREVVHRQEEQVQGIEKRLADMLAQVTILISLGSLLLGTLFVSCSIHSFSCTMAAIQIKSTAG